jgi:hypothetical protein
VEAAHEVDVHHPLDLIHVLPLELLRHEHAVVADEYVDGAGLLERARHGAGVPHVGRVDADVVPARVALDGGARVLEAGEVAGQDGDPRALPRRGRGHGEPDAAGPARDEDVAAFERDPRGPGPREERERGEQADGRRQQEEERHGHPDGSLLAAASAVELWGRGGVRRVWIWVAGLKKGGAGRRSGPALSGQPKVCLVVIDALVRSPRAFAVALREGLWTCRLAGNGRWPKLTDEMSSAIDEFTTGGAAIHVGHSDGTLGSHVCSGRKQEHGREHKDADWLQRSGLDRHGLSCPSPLLHAYRTNNNKKKSKLHARIQAHANYFYIYTRSYGNYFF